jgi:hypothetical protein
MKYYMLALMLVFTGVGFAQGGDTPPVPIDVALQQRSASVSDLPTLPPLDFQRTGDGKIQLDEGQFLSYIRAEIALKEAARAEVKSAIGEVNRATSLVTETDAQRQSDILQKEADIKKLKEMYAYMQDMHQYAKVTFDELQKTRSINQQTMGRLASAEGQIGAAHAEIEKQRRRAWIPAPISTVINLFDRD